MAQLIKLLRTESVRLRVSRFLLVSSYLAGLLGIGVFHWALFLKLTPFNLLLSFALLVWNHAPRSRAFWLYGAFAWAVGFFVEVAGVASGLIFGRYAYGEVFGIKWLDTPLLIGVNWAMLVYVSSDVANRLLPATMRAAPRIALAACIPVLLDVFMEPVAIRTGMWHWYGLLPPLQNYIGWYVVSLAIATLYHGLIGVDNRNPVSTWLLALQSCFFIGMNLL